MYAQEEAFKKSADFALSTSTVLSGVCLVSAVSVGIVAIPVILALWSISGLFNMTIGTCAESAPLFYCVTLAAMLAQIAAIVNAAKINSKDVAIDISRSAKEMAIHASDRAIPILHATVEKGKQYVGT
ncbi:Cation-transporting ATPase, related [Eimeria brunetti]|uniref:Cation-transporting ATPase, related n=1 Tax=Eimeria brunetti TaxID=51314 RepID=U6LEU0_9EIME|nr:Cation-transporting ATPase, related [Eimeria brunetti]